MVLPSRSKTWFSRYAGPKESYTYFLAYNIYDINDNFYFFFCNSSEIWIIPVIVFYQDTKILLEAVGGTYLKFIVKKHILVTELCFYVHTIFSKYVKVIMPYVITLKIKVYISILPEFSP